MQPAKVLMAVAALAAAGVSQAASRTPPTTGPKGPPARHHSHFPVGGMPNSARDYYAQVYGVDNLSAQLTDSGALVRFSYRVVDAAKAQALQDRSATPTMFDTVTRAELYIPVMDKVGPLRQSMSAKEGMSFWMAFSNKGGPVKTGHKVSVLVGSVRIDGLIVQ